MKKEYTNGDITIVWQPDMCQHSKICWQGMIEVFNPREKPWIKLEGAESDQIIAQVEKCPSGALSWHRNEK